MILYSKGNVGFGVVGDNWDYEHVRHHAFSNDVNLDPQQNVAPLITVDTKQLGAEKVEVRASVECKGRVSTNDSSPIYMLLHTIQPPMDFPPSVSRALVKIGHFFW